MLTALTSYVYIRIAIKYTMTIRASADLHLMYTYVLKLMEEKRTFTVFSILHLMYTYVLQC